MTVHTVTGPLEAAGLQGPVLPHEHLTLDLRTDADGEAILDARHTDAVAAEMARCHTAYGLGLVVDQTCRGMGRDVAALRRISTASGVPVVAATGWYYEHFHPGGEPPPDPDEATEILLRELTEGIDGTDVLAGVIGEIGTHGPEPTPGERVALIAAGRAGAETGRPVATHAHLGTGALAQLEVLAGTGVDLRRVCIGHQDLTDDAGQHAQIAAAGAYIGFDTVGKESYQSDDLRLQMLLGLLERGLGEHMLLSNDISRHAYLTTEGGQGYRHVLGPFAQRLRGEGVDEATMRLLYHDNPLRWLTGQTPSQDQPHPGEQAAGPAPEEAS